MRPCCVANRRSRRRSGLSVLLLGAAAAAAVSASPHGGPLGVFEGHGDVGSPKLAGSATYNAASQEYTLRAGGANMWDRRDELHFAWKRVSGDFILQAQLRLLGRGAHPHRKAGLLVRAGLEAEAAYVDGAVHGDGLTSLQFRRTAGAITEEIPLEIEGADVIQLERKGTTYTFSAARFGDPFSLTRISDLVLPGEVYVGLFLCSHDPEATEDAEFRNVRIVRPAPEGFVPYRDYIGSHLELLEVESGRRQIVLSSAEPFEAPNWTPDGSALIYNTSGASEARGRLRRFDLATRVSSPIDTGFAIRNNNDHVLSFDGTLLGISDHSQDDGQSTIFVVPASGGTPRRITPRTPSYLHGWSPDGRLLAYTGGRDGEFDVFTIPVDGSAEETRLTDSVGLDDGPEWSPDGRFIYFNSVRSGKMQIWRMRPDGSAPERLTHDDYNNWFAHPSPDGRQLALLSYGDDVAPADHPYYRNVYIRLMPATGGAPRVIAYVYGGQGTINVPSWSPDGKMLAFVSNSRIE